MTGFVDGLSALADRYDAFFIDQFGVMHDGTSAYPGAVEAMTRLTAAGRMVIVLTNSGKRTAPNIARIARLGFDRHSFSTLVSSGETTWQALRTGRFGPPFGAGRRLCVIGRAGKDYGLDDLDMTVVDDPGRAEVIVIAGSDCPATSLDRYRAMLAPAAALHVPALCANPDRLMLTVTGLQPAPGAIAAVYEALGGRVIYVGKPHAAIYEQARRVAGDAARRVLCIGDSLDHDIEGGSLAGCDTALVRTGIVADADDTTLASLIAAARHKPTYVLPSLRW